MSGWSAGFETGSACLRTGKQILSRGAAKRAVRALATRGRGRVRRKRDDRHGDNRPINVYLCRSCGGYHIGHTAPKPAR